MSAESARMPGMPSKQKKKSALAHIVRLDRGSSETFTMDQQLEQSSTPAKEWVPPMLRRLQGISLGMTCWLFVAALEIFHFFVERAQGLSYDQGFPELAARYAPTLGIIAMGYAWKAMIADIKMIIPYSNMNGTWVSAKQSLLLNYVNSLEIVSLFEAARRRHWKIVIALTIGFLSGALVALANALTYVNLSAIRTNSAPFVQTTTFDFENKLTLPNGSLSIPWNYTGNKPYAALSAKRMPNGAPPPWTIDGYAFDTFGPAESTTSQNATFTAEVSALAARLNCQMLRHNVIVEDYEITLTANSDDMNAALCTDPLVQGFFGGSLKGTESDIWLNMTKCSNREEDVRILLTVLDVPSDATNQSLEVTGLICSPQFTKQQAEVVVNGTSGAITSYSLLSSPDVIDPQTSAEALWIYLNNPLNVDVQTAFGRGGSNVFFNPNEKPIANLTSVIGAANDMVRRKLLPFSSLLMESRPGAISQYLQDPDILKDDAESLASDIWLQVANCFARKDSTIAMNGVIGQHGPRIFLRSSILRIMEALLALIGLACMLLSTIIRPRSAVTLNPRPIAATACMLAVSDRDMEESMANEARTARKSMETKMKTAECKMELMNGVPRIEYRAPTTVRYGEVESEKSTLNQLDFSSSWFRTAKRSFTTHKYESPKPISSKHAGWNPISLRLSVKISLIIAIGIVIVLLAVLQKISQSSQGLCMDSPAMSLTLSLIPTILLVLLGYAFCGVDAAIHSLAPYKSLLKASERQPLLSSSRTLPFSWSPWKAGGRRIGFSLAASSVVLLLIPIIKLVAAGLYNVTISQSSFSVDFNVDNSLASNLEKTYNVSSDSIVLRASEFTEWTSIPDFNVPPRSGIIHNMVLSNITDMAQLSNTTLLADSQLEARVPAVMIDAQCQVVPPEELNLTVSFSPRNKRGDGSYSFGWYCATANCARILNSTYLYSQTVQSDNLTVRYMGSAGIHNPDQTSAYDSDGLISTLRTQYNVILADFSGFTSPFTNKTEISSNKTWVTRPDIFNVTLPKVFAVACKRNMSEISVNATFSRATTYAYSGNNSTRTDLLPWSPISVNKLTIDIERVYSPMQPSFFTPVSAAFNQYASSTEQDGEISSDSLWPTRGSSTNFFELLAAHASRTNLTALLDPDGLKNATEEVLTAYLTQILTELRPIAATNGSASLSLTGTMQSSQPRIAQDMATTIALEVLLTTTLICLLWIFFRFPNAAVIPKPPDSIAARLSLLAGSSLVARLRKVNDKASTGNEADIWKETAALGWWSKDHEHNESDVSSDTLTVPEDSEESRTSKWRWGIDVGVRHLGQGDWNDPPESQHDSSSTLVASNPPDRPPPPPPLQQDMSHERNDSIGGENASLMGTAYTRSMQRSSDGQAQDSPHVSRTSHDKSGDIGASMISPPQLPELQFLLDR